MSSTMNTTSTAPLHRTRVVILGAAGRDFHDFNVVFRDDPDLRGRRLHRDADPRHRGPSLSARARGIAVSARHPDRRGDGARATCSSANTSTSSSSPTRTCATSRSCTSPRAASRPAPTSGCHSARRTMLRSTPPGRRRDRRAHRRRQEPDHPLPRPDAASTSACASSRSATRCPTATSPPRPASASRHMPTSTARVHHRGARGVRAAPRRRRRRLRRRRLRADPARGRAGGRRHPLGRRQQRPAVLRARPARRARRPAAPGRRGGIPPRRGQRPDGRRRRHRQVRLGADGRHRGRRGVGPRAQPARDRAARRQPRHRGRPEQPSPDAASSSSRTARP